MIWKIRWCVGDSSSRLCTSLLIVYILDIFFDAHDVLIWWMLLLGFWSHGERECIEDMKKCTCWCYYMDEPHGWFLMSGCIFCCFMTHSYVVSIIWFSCWCICGVWWWFLLVVMILLQSVDWWDGDDQDVERPCTSTFFG